MALMQAACYSMFTDCAHAPIAEYVELKTSAALLPLLLERIYHGKRVRFGERLSMDRAGVHQSRKCCPWSDVTGIYADGTYVAVNLIDGRRMFQLSTRFVPFSMVAQAVARIMTEEGLPAAP
jgi:hypothetical protein